MSPVPLRREKLDARGLLYWWSRKNISRSSVRDSLGSIRRSIRGFLGVVRYVLVVSVRTHRGHLNGPNTVSIRAREVEYPLVVRKLPVHFIYSERKDLVFEQVVRGDECSFLSVFLCYRTLPISGLQVET